MMIPRYGELNRIYRDYIDNHVFSFGRQKFISDFCQEYNDMKAEFNLQMQQNSD